MDRSIQKVLTMTNLITPSSAQTLADHRSRLQRVAVDGGDLAYLDSGPKDGHPVVLLHGMPTSPWLYRDVAARLATLGVPVEPRRRRHAVQEHDRVTVLRTGVE